MTHHLRACLLALLAVLLAAPPGAGQAKEEDLASPKLRIEWAEFKKLYDAKKIELVDVRGADAFKAGRIPGARSVPLDTVEKRAGDLKKLNKPIVTYCA
jgi:3-mercaptopyruvate sulfurtransferase SseA